MVVVQLEGKAAKSESAANEFETKSTRVNEKPISAAEALQKITNLVRCNASEIAEKLIQVAKEGQLNHAKYLFEMAGIHPASSEATSKPEESVVYSWLKEIGLQPEVCDKGSAREDGSGVESRPAGSFTRADAKPH